MWMGNYTPINLLGLLIQSTLIENFLLANFLGRSNGWNTRIAMAAHSRGLAVVHQDGSKSVDAMVDEIVALMEP